MDINKENLLSALLKFDIDQEKAELIWNDLNKNAGDKSKFNVENFAYYFGAMIIMGAMGWLMTSAWNSVGGLGVTFLGLAYFLVFLLTGYIFWYKKNIKIPGGLLFTIAVWMVPLIVFGIEKYTGLWIDESPGGFTRYHQLIRSSWLIMEITTIVVGFIILIYVKFPFLTFPIAFSLWYMSMDIAPFIIKEYELSWHEKQMVSIVFGLCMIVVAYLVDKRTKEDFAFWLYLFGMLAFWGGLSTMEGGSDMKKFLYCLLNIFLMFISVVLQRRVFMIFGAIGVSVYLGYLSYHVFEDSLLFPVVLSLIGIGVIYLGIVYNRKKDVVEKKILNILPRFILELDPDKRTRKK
jgi:hypothetical protein